MFSLAPAIFLCVIDICHVDCLYVSVTNNANTLVTEHIYFGHLMLYFFLSDVIFVNVVNVIIW